MTELEKQQYFDWAATSPADEDILHDALELSLGAWGNPSSAHRAGKEARSALEAARELAASVLGVPAGTLYFTSGGTESDQIPILSVLTKPRAGTVLISALEHPAVREQARALEKCGWHIISIPSEKDGIVMPQTVTRLLTDDTALVCVMAVNNETGAIQPVQEIAEAIAVATAGKRRPKFHVDCVQAAGKIPLRLCDGIDFAAFSAHKICGPRGIGLLYSKTVPESFLRGGGQENGVRSGTENVFGAVALARCLERYAIRSGNPGAEQAFERQRTATEQFVRRLSALKGCAIISSERLEHPERYSPYVVQAAFKNIPGNVMLRALDSKGFCISTGSACSTKKNSRPVLEAMNVPADQRENSVRFSFGPHTTVQAMDGLFEAVAQVNADFNR